MDAVVEPWELVERFFDASVSPERLAELINVWDDQIAAADSPRSVNLGSAFAHQVAAVFQILEQLQAAELQRVNDLLSEIHTAAMVLSEDGHVIAANRAAHVAFGRERDGPIGSLPLELTELQEFADLVAAVAEAAGSRETVLRLRPNGLDRLLIVQLKSFHAVWLSRLGAKTTGPTIDIATSVCSQAPAMDGLLNSGTTPKLRASSQNACDPHYHRLSM